MIHWPKPKEWRPVPHVRRAPGTSRWLPRRTGTVLVVTALAIVDMLAVLAVLAVLGALVMPALATT
ncbi:MAG: hypothetical protein Q8K55_02495 [Gemmatimonadaceae bacterium]|nr:hypothetical protein [Gemmatimonadaceae bacterium]